MLDSSEILAVAHAAHSLSDYERSMLNRIRGELEADVAFVVRGSGIGAGSFGLRPELARAASGRMGRYGAELAPVFDAARSQAGVAVDRDVLGHAWSRTSVYRELIAPHGGRCTLLGCLALGGEPLATIALGRTAGSFRTWQLESLSTLLPVLSLCDAALRHKEVLCAGLSAREFEVVRCLRLGYSNAQIAVALGSSINTVRNQLRSVFRKLNASTRAEVVALSFGHGA